MVDFGNIAGFEWDKGNANKSYQKHGITPNEAEEVFLDPEQLIFEDNKHSQKEKRFIVRKYVMAKDALGKTPLDYAESKEMISLLKKHGSKELY